MRTIKVTPPIKVNMCLVPTCQVRVSRSYQRCCVPPPASPSASSASDSTSATSTATARFQWALLDPKMRPQREQPQPRAWAQPDLNRERQMSVGTAPELSGHCRTSTARARSWAPPDLNCECKMSHRMSDRMPEINVGIHAK